MSHDLYPATGGLLEDDGQHSVELGADTGESGITEAEFEEAPVNRYVLALEDTIRQRALAEGRSEGDLDIADAATFTLRDEAGNPTDTLKVGISHYKGMYSRPGVQGFDLRPINGPKDGYGRDAQFVTGSFWGSLQNPDAGAFSMNYAGDAEQMRQYADTAMQPESLARAEMQLHIPEVQ